MGELRAAGNESELGSPRRVDRPAIECAAIKRPEVIPEMAEFPTQPVSPKEFMEGFVPQALAEAASKEGAALSVKLGVLLEGDGGGEWVVHLDQGSVDVREEPRNGASFTIIQTTDDWRGALWEGRGGVFGTSGRALFEGRGPAAGAPGAAPNMAALDQLALLDGMIRVVVTGGEGGDWSTAFKLGVGEIPEVPTTTVTVSAEDAAALQTGELDPMQAFMSGKIRVEGDMTLMMQMQAISMAAAAQD
jgi:putative sterol carrier protein